MKKVFEIIFLVLIFWNLCPSGEWTNLQGIGMARTFTAVAYGSDALNINPANLFDPSKNFGNLNLFNFGISSGSDFIDINLYNKYFTGDANGNPVYLHDADKRKILDVFPAGLAQTGFNFNLVLFALTFHIKNAGSFALNVQERTGVNILLPKSYLEFILYGNLLNSKYDFKKTYFNAIWFREYSLSYAREIPFPDFVKSLSAGLSIKLVHGFGFAEMSHNRTYLLTDAESKISGKIDYQVKFSGVNFLNEESNEKFSPFPCPAGSGIGFDFGVRAFVNEQLVVGLAIIDIGKISWSLNTYEHSGYAEFSFDDPKTGKEQIDSLDRIFKGTNRKIGAFNSVLPSVLRLGVAYRFDKAPFIKNFPGELLLAFDYNQGFNNIAGNTTIPRFSLGVEYKPWLWLPIRTGISIGGNEGFSWAFGTGLNFSFLDIEFATQNFDAVIFPNSFDRISFGMGMKIKF